MKTTLILLLMLAPLLADARSMRAKIFAPGEEKPSYLFSLNVEKKGDSVHSKSIFTDLAGKALVEETSVYRDQSLVSHTFQQLQVDEKGSIDIRDGKVFYSFTSQGKTHTETADIEPEMVISDAIVPYILQHWDQLEKGETLKVRFLLLERQESIGFKFYKDKEHNFKGKDAVDILMRPTSIFIAQLVPKIRFTFEKAAPHRLIESVGRTPIRVPEVPNPKRRKDYRALDGRMEWEYLE